LLLVRPSSVAIRPQINNQKSKIKNELMRLIAVIDLLDGRAVHARFGERELYRPVERVAGIDVRGDPETLARIYRERCGISELYVADLDAIRGQRQQSAALCASAGVGVGFCLDAGIRTVDEARRAFDVGAARAVVGLETLHSYAELAAIARSCAPEQVVFSLDLRDDVPIVAADADIDGVAPDVIAQRAAAAGASAIVVLDLARVGSGRGLAFELLATIRAAVPDVQLFAGGGVRGVNDVARLRALGCDGALVASALHTGKLAIDLRNVIGRMP
jgi:phosphoribosylformimino-5-aminoimidazole carboxamide ribotide isomerase